MSVSADTKAFEAQRLEFFATCGFMGESRRIPDRDGRETYLMAGGRGPRSRLLIHGGLSESTAWATLAGLLEGSVVVPDRPGYGLSYPIDYRQVDDFLEEAAGWLLDVVDGLGEDRVDLVGNSMGGLFSVAFALGHPDRVNRLVLLGALPGVQREVPWFLKVWANPVLGRLMMRSGLDSPEQMRTRVYPGLVAHPERVPAAQLEIEHTAGMLPHAALTSQTMLRAVIGAKGFRTRYLMRDRLPDIETPTLIAWGSEDTAFGKPSIGRQIAARMPNATFELIPDAGHLPWLDEPHLVADLVNSYLDTTLGRA